MTPSPGPGRFGTRLSRVILTAAASFLILSPLAAQTPAAGTDPATAAPPANVIEDQITVTATRSPRALKDTPGAVDVLDHEDIDRDMIRSTSDLVKFTPGVYVDNDPTRLGANGFNIRGIGGNRVLTRIDGIEVGQSFSFGPLAAPQLGLDLDALEKVEIVRSAGSALYGSNALGGVVSLITKDPSDYLAGAPGHVEGRAGYTGLDRERLEDGAVALAGNRWQGSLFASRSDGHETENQGTRRSLDENRTAPNPQDFGLTSLLGKLAFEPSDSSLLKLTGEVRRGSTATRVFSGYGLTELGPEVSEDVGRFDADDDQRRDRVSLEQSVVASTLLWSSLDWRLYYRQDERAEHTSQDLTTLGEDEDPTVPASILRRGLLTFDQTGEGGEIHLQKELPFGQQGQRLTYGASYTRDRFDQRRDSVDQDLATGAQNVYLGPFVYPTKYFPTSTVVEAGAYLQDELTLAGGRVRLVPGVRFDRYQLQADRHDPVYLAGNAGIQAPADLDNSSVSPRLGAVVQLSDWLSAYGQYAHGFRAPAFDAVNSGFTNFASGYTTLPNPDLKPETSANSEVGLRGTWAHAHVSVDYFYNRYKDFIDFVVRDFNPETGLLEFQNQNDQRATIKGFEIAGDARLGDAWNLRFSAAKVQGRNDSARLPLNSVAPESGVLGLRYTRPAARWGAEVVASLVGTKSASDVDRTEVNQFAPPSYQTVDCTVFVKLQQGLSLNLGAFNVFDQKYWSWPNVAGIESGSPVLDRYTSPGRTFAASLRWSR